MPWVYGWKHWHTESEFTIECGRVLTKLWYLAFYASLFLGRVWDLCERLTTLLYLTLSSKNPDKPASVWGHRGTQRKQVCLTEMGWTMQPNYSLCKTLSLISQPLNGVNDIVSFPTERQCQHIVIHMLSPQFCWNYFHYFHQSSPS